MTTPIPLGHIVATPGALETFGNDILTACLSRHETGDWGDICEEDKKLNDIDAQCEGRVLSSYDIRGDKLWIITEADRSSTTLLLPDEY